MAGNAWDGYLWVDGWPVTPPRLQQRTPPEPLPAPDPLPPPPPQPVPAPPSPMQPPSLHQPAQPINNSGDQVILAQVASKNEEEEDRASNYTGTSYDPSQLTDSEEEDAVDDTIVKLGNGYAQCRAAREAAMAAEVTDISCNSNALSTEKKKGFRVGSMDKNL